MTATYRSILITGASSGIGAALAEEYAAPGVHLALSGRDVGRLEAVSARCKESGADIISARPLDVTDAPAMAAWIDETDETRPLDLVIANAGVSSDTTGLDDREGRAAAIRRTNIDGVLNTIEPAVPRMRARGAGQLALMSSLAGFRGVTSAPAYAASKAWVRSYGESLRGVLAGDGIGVTVICPGFVESRITAANRFHMPMLMDAARAARIVRRGLARNKPRIAFPLPMYAMVLAISALPPGLTDSLFARLPRKE